MSKKYFEKLAKNSATSSKEYSSAFGLKILEKFGWQKGDGLGANLDGARDCIQISRREEKVGLGGEKVNDDSDAKQWDNWWAGAYNSVAGKLGPIEYLILNIGFGFLYVGWVHSSSSSIGGFASAWLRVFFHT